MKVVTGKVRFSYVHLFEPRKNDDGSSDRYSVTLLIPKTDTETMAKIKAAIKAAADKFREKNGVKSLPANPATTLHDGDGLRENGEPFGPECKGCYVITATSNTKPGIYDAFKNDITDPNELYSGCYGRAAINFAGYNYKGRKGISAYLVSVKKLTDGEPLGGAIATADDYDDDYEDDDDII